MGKIIPDISHYHPVKDWKAAAANCEFMISKATEGTTYTDNTLKSFIAGCEANKIPYWLYSFARKGKELDGVKFLVKTCKGLVGDYFVGYALDVENALNGSKPNCKGVIDAINYLDKLGYKTMLYTMYAQYSTYKEAIEKRPSNCAWWEARYGSNTGKDTSAKYPCHNGVDLHQYTSVATFPYFRGGVDLNKVRTVNGKTLEWYKTKTSLNKDLNKDLNKTNEKKPTKLYDKAFPKLPKRGYYKFGDGYISLENYNSEIMKLQLFLNWCLGEKIAVDGKYGTKTRNTVLMYQKKYKLKKDGLFGAKCLEKAKTIKA